MPTAGWRGIGLVVVGRCEPARANRSDDRVLVGVALAGDESLDGADGHALVVDLMVIAPGRQDREPTAKRMGSVDTGMTTNLFVYDQVDAASLVLNLGEPTLEAEESHTASRSQ